MACPGLMAAPAMVHAAWGHRHIKGRRMPDHPAAQECVGRLPAVAGGLARLLPGVGAGRGCGVVNGLKPQVVVSADFLTWVILNFPGKCKNQFFLLNQTLRENMKKNTHFNLFIWVWQIRSLNDLLGNNHQKSNC